MPADPPPRPFALRVLTLAAVLGCGLILYPVLPGTTWGVAFAVVAWPLQRRLVPLVKSRTLAAAVTTALASLALIVPCVLVAGQLVREARAVQVEAQKQVESGEWRESVRGVPYAGEWLLEQADGASPEQIARAGLARVGGVLMPVAGGVGAAAVQALVAAFVLFFALRDGPELAAQVGRLIPADPVTARHLLARGADAVWATLAGTVLAGLVQGVTGGLLFWALGLPAAVLWGVVMFVVSVLPVLGAFVVWVPAAVYLAGQGETGRALALVAWGLVMAGPVGNLIYARAAGDRMKLHPVVTLLAFLGGLAAFGVSGMVLGPVLVVLATELSAVWAGRAVVEADSTPG